MSRTYQSVIREHSVCYSRTFSRRQSKHLRFAMTPNSSYKMRLHSQTFYMTFNLRQSNILDL